MRCESLTLSSSIGRPRTRPRSWTRRSSRELIGVDIAAFEGASSGLLDDDDIVDLLAEIDVGTTIAVLLVEHTALLPTIRSFAATGSRLVVDGQIGLEDLETALAATEDD